MQAYTIGEQIFIIKDFWSKERCDEYIKIGEGIGFKSAPINTGMGQRVISSIRNNKRVLFDSEALAKSLWVELAQFAPWRIGNSTAIGLNELFRFYRYKPGEEFKKHRDQSYSRNSLESSYYTFMIYLNDDFDGGETTFDGKLITPTTGMALIFLHSLEHAGNPVRSGTKYVLRTDIMYRLDIQDNSVTG